MKFAKFLTVALLLALFMGGIVKAQDTTHTGLVSHDVGYSITTSFTKDSTQATVTNWFDGTSFNDKYIYLSHTYTDLFFGRSAGNDTIRCILQAKDAAGNIFNSDTIGTGSEGSEKLVSSGTSAQYLVTPKKYGVAYRLYYEAVVTGTHKNGRGTYVGALTFINKDTQ